MYENQRTEMRLYADIQPVIRWIGQQILKATSHA